MSAESEEQPISVASYDGYTVSVNWYNDAGAGEAWHATAAGVSIANVSGIGDTKEDALTNLVLSLCRFLDAVNPNAPKR